jgi:putative membrane protein
VSLLFHVTGALAALLHVLFFLLESVLWRRPGVHGGVFGLSPDAAQAARPFAFNQGFYNLFLAAGAGGGALASALGHATPGRAVAAFALASMLAAALVLLASRPALWLGALIQGGPPAVALAALWLGD